MRPLACLTSLVLSATMIAGCGEGLRADWWKQLGKPKGEEWTILCADLRGPDRVARAERLAAELKQTPGIRQNDVRLYHDGDAVKLLYGAYLRRIDPQTGRLDIPDSLRQDLRLVQTGTAPQGGRFWAAQATSAPWTDVGDPAWRLENASGTYTLLVAVFENTADFYDRKAAAAAYARELRRAGFEAYYRHAKITSEVTVGTFGPNAMRTTGTMQLEREPDFATGYTPHVVAVTDYAPEVRRLQQQRDFRYLLRNMRRESIKGRYGRQYTASRLIPIRPEDATW